MKKQNNKLFESLPRQSTVDQLHRIREEIKKSQKIKVGPEEIIMSGDIGDRVINDLIKHKGKQEMNNLFWWDNPTDRYICSYEDYVKNDSRDSLGYTPDGDPKSHKGTDFVKENLNKFDPYNEDNWGPDEKTKLLKSKIIDMCSKDPKFDERDQKHINYFLKSLEKEDIGEEQIYEVREYNDGGPNDEGYRKGFVKARNKVEAKAIWGLKTKSSYNFYNGFLGFRRYPQANFDRDLRDLRKALDRMENMPDINNI